MCACKKSIDSASRDEKALIFIDYVESRGDSNQMSYYLLLNVNSNRSIWVDFGLTFGKR